MTGLPPIGRFPGVPAESMTAEQAALAAAFVERRGLVPGPYKIWLSSPEFATRIKQLSDYLLRGGALSARECEIAVLVAARRLGAPYIEAAHRKIAADAGVPAAAIEAICNGDTPALDDPRERAVYEAACIMVGERPDAQAAFDLVVAQLGHDGVSELSGLLGFYSACAFILQFYAVAPRA